MRKRQGFAASHDCNSAGKPFFVIEAFEAGYSALIGFYFEVSCVTHLSTVRNYLATKLGVAVRPSEQTAGGEVSGSHPSTAEDGAFLTAVNMLMAKFMEEDELDFARRTLRRNCGRA